MMMGGKAAVLALLLLSAPAGAQEVWRYVDESGVIHFADTPRHTGFELVSGETDEDVQGPQAFSDNLLYDGIIADVASRFGLEPELIKAVIKTESDFDPFAVSAKGAMGLMQLIQETADQMGVEQVFDPRENIEGGSRYLGYLIDRFGGDLDLALAAYNAGENAVARYGNKVPPFPETREYVKKVRSALKYYRILSS